MRGLLSTYSARATLYIQCEGYTLHIVRGLDFIVRGLHSIVRGLILSNLRAEMLVMRKKEISRLRCVGGLVLKYRKQLAAASVGLA